MEAGRNDSLSTAPRARCPPSSCHATCRRAAAWRSGLDRQAKESRNDLGGQEGDDRPQQQRCKQAGGQQRCRKGDWEVIRAI